MQEVKSKVIEKIEFEKGNFSTVTALLTVYGLSGIRRKEQNESFSLFV